MALANVAWILAASGNRVAVIDWDLEAPGLHRYFHPYLDDPDLVRSPGIIDFVMTFAREAIKPAKGDLDASWYLPYANLLRYASSLRYEFPGQGTIDFIPSGRQGSDYAARVNSFNWSAFYENQQGGLFLEAAKQSLGSYDWVLIDSRTGVSDTSGICTVQMPQVLVVCFTPNAQSIEGASAIARSADQQRARADGTPTLRVLPVMTRVLTAEKVRVEAAKRNARERFDGLLWHLGDAAARDRYWARMPVPQEPFYAFEEVLAVFGDEAGRQDTMLASMEHLAGHVVRAWADTEEAEAQPLRLPPLSEAARQTELSKFVRFVRPAEPTPSTPVPEDAAPRPAPGESATHAAPAAPEYWFYVSYARADDSPYLRRFCEDLAREIALKTAERPDRIMFLSSDSTPVGSVLWRQHADALSAARTMVAMVTPHYLRSEFCGREWQLFSERARPGTQPSIVPVQWAPVEGALPAAVSKYLLWGGNEPRAVHQLARLRREQYFDLISRMAVSMVKIGRQGRAAPAQAPSSLEGVANAFADLDDRRHSRPDIAVLVVLAGSSREMTEIRRESPAYGESAEDWAPWPPRKVIELASGAVAEAGLSAVMLSGGDAAMLSTSQPTLVVVDLWALRLERVRTQLAHFNSTQQDITGYIVVSGAGKVGEEEEEAGLRALLRRTLDDASRSPKKFREVRTEAELTLAVVSIATTLKLELISSAAAGSPALAAPPNLPKVS